MNCTSNNPRKVQRNATIAQDRLAGMTYRELAGKYEIDKGQISRILNDPEIKDIIETGTKQLVSMIPKAVDNYRTFLTDSKSEHHYKASKDALQATGILPSHTQSQTIVNIFNQTNNLIADPKLLGMMEKYADDNVIDIDLGLGDNDIDSDLKDLP